MFLHELFPPELTIVTLESENKEQLFKEMVNHFCRIKSIDIGGEILEALWERENKMTTGIRKGVAVPHAKIENLDSVYGVLGISKKGIDYEALDMCPVNLVFMFFTPLLDTEKHLRILMRLAGLLKDPVFFDEMLRQDDPPAANQIIKKYEDVST